MLADQRGERTPASDSSLVLAADVPDSEGQVLVLDGLDVEANGRDRGHDLASQAKLPSRLPPFFASWSLSLSLSSPSDAARFAVLPGIAKQGSGTRKRGRDLALLIQVIGGQPIPLSLLAA